MAEMDKTKSLVWDVKHSTDSLVQMHSVVDSNGVPLWYVPRDWGETQKQIVDTQHEIAMTLQVIANTLERIEDKS
jgi:hypothetical protein